MLSLFGTLLVCSVSVLSQKGVSAKHTVPLVTGCGRGGTHSTAAMLNKLGAPALHEDYGPDSISVSWPYGAPIANGEYIGYTFLPAGRYPFEKITSYNSRIESLSKYEPVVILVRDPIKVISSTRRCFCAKGFRYAEPQIKADNRSWWFVEHNINLTRYYPELKSDGSLTEWSDLPVDSVVRSMVYWVGWNEMVEERRLDELAGYDTPMSLDFIRKNNKHIVQLEDPQMLTKLTQKLGLSQTIIEAAELQAMENAGGGESNAEDKKKFGEVSWADMWLAAPSLAQKVWSTAQRYGYFTEEPAILTAYLRHPGQNKYVQDY